MPTLISMPSNQFEIVPYDPNYRQQILTIWERSVLATHHFLKPTDFDAIKGLVAGFQFNELPVFCLVQGSEVAGFMGVADKKIEMLFIDPHYFGQGLGLRLLSYAVNTLSAVKVDVNEQNTKAVHFYQTFGFETYERTEKDNTGRNYPLLRMKLAKI